MDAVNDECSLRAAIELVVDAEGPLRGFTAAETKALLQVTAEEESHWDMAQIGDHGRAHCALQVWRSVPRDAVECVNVGLERMRESIAICPSNPLATYCGGCHVPAAQRISSRRIKRARMMAKRKGV